MTNKKMSRDYRQKRSNLQGESSWLMDVLIPHKEDQQQVEQLTARRIERK